MNEEIKLNKRQPTWNYILNDLALYSLMTKVIHSEEATNQEKFDFMYQIELLQQENARLKDKIEKVIEYANSDEFEQLFESCANFNEANCNINYFLKEN